MCIIMYYSNVAFGTYLTLFVVLHYLLCTSPIILITNKLQTIISDFNSPVCYSATWLCSTNIVVVAPILI